MAVDSVFWGRWLWPEGEVLWFNTALNKSHEWGTQARHWYFTSAIPRAMLGSVLLVPFGLFSRAYPLFFIGVPGSRLRLGVDRRLAAYMLPVLGFVCLYSFLPHKELRFILPVVPMLICAAAHGWDKL